MKTVPVGEALGMVLAPLETGIITTGSEAYHGRITDKFGPVVREKLKALGCPVFGQVFVADRRGRRRLSEQWRPDDYHHGRHVGRPRRCDAGRHESLGRKGRYVRSAGPAGCDVHAGLCGQCPGSGASGLRNVPSNEYFRPCPPKDPVGKGIDPQGLHPAPARWVVRALRELHVSGLWVR